MKILFSLTNLQIGGAQIFTLQLAYELQKKGHEVVVFSHQGDYDVLSKENLKIYSLARYKWLNFLVWKLSGILNKTKVTKKFAETLSDIFFYRLVSVFQPDVISSQMSFSDKKVVECLTRCKLRFKKIFFVPTLHGEYELGLCEKQTIEKIKKYSDALIYTTDKNINCFQDYSKIKKKIGIGFSLDFFKEMYRPVTRQELKIPDDYFVYGMVARGIPEKGWQNLIFCFKELNKKYSSTYLLLIGDGNYLKNLVEESNHPNIRLLQLENQPFQFLNYLNIIDVGLLPTYFKGESFPNIIIQYLYFNKPVIATDIGEIRNMIEWNGKRVGILIPLRKGVLHNDDLLYAMESMLNKENYLNYVENIHYFKEHFSMDKVAEEYESFFNNLISN